MAIIIGQNAKFDSAAASSLSQKSKRDLLLRDAELASQQRNADRSFISGEMRTRRSRQDEQARADQAQLNNERDYQAGERRARTAADERKNAAANATVARQDGYQQQQKMAMLNEAIGQQNALFEDKLKRGQMDYEYSQKDQADFNRLQTRLKNIQSDKTLRPDQKAEFEFQIKQEMAGITPSLRLQTRPEFPEGQGIGQSWQDGLVRNTRTSKGEVKVLSEITPKDVTSIMDNAMKSSFVEPLGEALEGYQDWNKWFGQVAGSLRVISKMKGIDIEQSGLLVDVMEMIPIDKRDEVMRTYGIGQANQPEQPTQMDPQVGPGIEKDQPQAEPDVPEALLQFEPSDRETITTYAAAHPDIPLELIIERLTNTQ